MGKNQIVSNEELLVSNMLELEALRRILVRRGITTDDEVMSEIEKIKAEMEEKLRNSQKLN